MTYKVYIKQDYKAKIERGLSFKRSLACLGTLGLAVTFLIFNTYPGSGSAMIEPVVTIDQGMTSQSRPIQSIGNVESAPVKQVLPEPDSTTDAPSEQTVLVPVPEIESIMKPAVAEESSPEPIWQEVTVRKGDSLARIFKRLSLSPRTLHEIMTADEQSRSLKNIMPGQILRFDILDGQLQAMEYDIDYRKTLAVTNTENGISVALEEVDLEKRVRHATVSIRNSLYLAGQAAGLSDKLIMQLVTLYGWDIDFALDIRNGDHFSVMFEEYYKDGEKVDDGPILAAEFTNRGNSFKSVRFTHPNGDSQYYADDGHSMRKAFLRTPVKFSRISSGFNLRRKHPILNTIRAHKGVDYAAPRGTPVKATGDGVVIHKGTKGGYGRTVAIRHGSTYSTLYAHMSRYGKKIRNGTRVKQGQIIGYVGSSGLATGPHLHYEFRVHGVHRNPLTVKLPKAARIPDELMDEFIAQTTPLLAQLDDFRKQIDFADNSTPAQSDLIAMNKETSPPPTTTR